MKPPSSKDGGGFFIPEMKLVACQRILFALRAAVAVRHAEAIIAQPAVIGLGTH